MRLRLLAVLALALPVAAQPTVPDAGLVALPGIPATGLPGLETGDTFGSSAASAGDVNGDGYDDVIVGAPRGGINDSGRAYLFFGGPGADATPDVTFAGLSGDWLGRSVAAAGDVNGDGYDDMIVGAPYDDQPGAANAGSAFVYFGGPAPDATPDLIVAGPSASDNLGLSVAGAGDVNGDGYDDLLVGVPFSDVAGTSTGSAMLFLGGAVPDAVPDLVLTDAVALEQFGLSVAGAGDVNGDGYDDLLVGAPFNDGGGSNAGRALLFLGGAVPDASPDLIFPGAGALSFFGGAVNGAGDVNGDGYDDLLIGADTANLGGPGIGRAFLFLGGGAPDATADLTHSGETIGDAFGAAVAGAGDLNGDGYADLAVGAPLHDGAGVDAGEAYVFFGGPTPDALPDVVRAGAAGAELGAAVGAAGDVDGDGLTDLLVGAPSPDGTGAVLVLSNANRGALLSEGEVTGATPSLDFGAEVALVGDVDGDGFDDVVVGSPGADTGGTNTGRAELFLGGVEMSLAPALTLAGAAFFDAFGAVIAGVGDLNGDGYDDGYDDVAVGAPGNDGGGTDAGRVYVYLGAATPNTTADLILSGLAGDQFGGAVAGAGDVNGDGFDDLLVGAPENDAGGTDAGRAYLYFGGATPNNVPDLTLTGTGGGWLGISVAGAGDLNGDGFDDLVVGESAASVTNTAQGRVLVYLGGAAPDAVADLAVLGIGGSDNFGVSVAVPGDVNGDGFEDWIAGAVLNDTGGADAGRAYLFFGGATLDGVPDLTVTGEAPGDLLGNIAGAGDLDGDGDGYDDLVVGATQNDAGGTDAGRASVYFGGPSLDATPDLVFTGTAGDRLGGALAGGGDTNGDGRADLLLGSPSAEAGGAIRGRASLYRLTGPSVRPSLFSVADAPGDEGGALRIRWTRSDREATGGIVTYLIERSRPAGVGGYVWELVSNVAPTGVPRYTRLVDAFAPAPGFPFALTCVRVTAFGTAGETWRSGIDCATASDNLPPATPADLTLTASADGDVLLAWSPVSGASDIAGYDVYRAPTAACGPDRVLAGATNGVLATSFEDHATDYGTDVWYCVASRDDSGNRSAASASASANPAVLARVRVVLEGAYAPGLPGGAWMRTDLEDVLPLAQPYAAAPWNHAGTEAIPATDVSPANGRPDLLDAYDVVDWVLVSLRSTATGADVARAAALLLADGSLLDPATGADAVAWRPLPPGSYHVVVSHRNHLAAMSAAAVPLDGVGPTNVDLSASPSAVYGADPVRLLAPGVYGLWAGDANASGTVTAQDATGRWRAQAGRAGYRAADLDLDGRVLADDRQRLLLPNVGQTTRVPGASLAPPATDRRPAISTSAP